MNPTDEQQKVVSQWIVSLAVSVVCCATLFIVFAIYIMNLSDKTTLVGLRLEIIQQRQQQIVTDIDYIRRTMVQLPQLVQTSHAPHVLPVSSTSAQQHGETPEAPKPAPSEPTSAQVSDNAPQKTTGE